MNLGIAPDLDANVNRIINTPWDIRQGRAVPGTDDVALDGGGVELDATVLYADMSESSKLSSELYRRTAAKVIKCFLYCASRLVAHNGGAITAFDGDRVMGIFVGDSKNTSAVICALQLNYVVQKSIRPRLTEHFTSIRDTGFEIRHAVGVDTGQVLAVRTGIRGSNDLTWVGRPPNFAAKLSAVREEPYYSFITDEVFQKTHESARINGEPKRLMWEPQTYEWLGEKLPIHRSSWWWTP